MKLSLKRSIIMFHLILQTITEIMGKGSKLKDDPKSPAFLARNVYPSLSSFTFLHLENSDKENKANDVIIKLLNGLTIVAPSSNQNRFASTSP
jgi:hypothetical protein